jgi:small-conductance mechanosensitive channel
MSGIILLIERPLRVGDIVEMGTTFGSVTNISIRASTVLSSNGIETLIPNSNFLENVVTNWTYSDRRVRREIKIGVPRSASTRQVSDLLLSTAQRHGQLLKDPAPKVLLQDFAADTLMYSLQYWTEFRAGMDPDVVASDLRFMIETAFKEAGLSKTAPVEVNVSSAVPQSAVPQKVT